MCLSISVLSYVSINVQFSCTEKDSVLRDRYDEVISLAASRTSSQLVVWNLMIVLCACLFLEVIRLNFVMTSLWSDIPRFDVTSTTVSGILVMIKSSVFPDAGRMISLQC